MIKIILKDGKIVTDPDGLTREEAIDVVKYTMKGMQSLSDVQKTNRKLALFGLVLIVLVGPSIVILKILDWIKP